MKINRGDGIFFAILAGAIAVVFGSSLFFTEQILDDIIYVGRFHLLSFSLNNLKVWWEPILGLWSPLVGYSFMLDYFLWGKEHFFFGAHLVNILLHFLAAAGFYTGARLLKFSRIAAGIAVLIWAVHPQRAESVAWLSERKDVLFLALGLWCTVFFILSMKHKKKYWYVLSVFLFALSFCIKPALIGLPAILTAYLWGRYRRKDWLFYVKYSGLFWLLSLIYYIVFKCVAPEGNLFGGKNFSDQLILIGWRFGSYFVKTFVPYGLNPYYPHFSLANDSLLPLYAVGIIALLLLEFLRRGNKKALYLYLPLFISFSAAVAPGLLKIGDVDFADRYSYYPSIFAVLAAAAGMCTLVNKFPRIRNLMIAGVCCLIPGMGIMCSGEVAVWESAASYTRATLDHPLPNYRCLIGETIVKFDKRDYAAVQKNILRLRNDYTDIPVNRKRTIDFFVESIEGVILIRQGQTKAGMKKLILVLSHSHWRLLLNTSYGYPRMVLLTAAGVCQRAGNKKDAAEMYRRLANLYGTYEPMEKEFYLALAALCLNDRTTALRHFENAHKLNPGDENIRKNIEILRKHQPEQH